MKKKKISINIAICIALLWVLIYAFAPVPTHAATNMIIPAEADCYLDAYGATHNNYELTAYPYFISYIRFNLSSIPPGSILNNVTLRLGTTKYGYTGNGDGVNIFSASDNWTETDASSAAIIKHIYTTDGLNGESWFSFTNADIINYAQAEFNGDKQLSFALRAGNMNTSARFHSRETNGYTPYLEVTYTLAPAITVTSDDVAYDNTYIGIGFNMGVYSANNGTGGLTASNFALTFNQNGGTATGATITSVSKFEGTGAALSGGEGAARVYFNVIGTPSGVETIEIKPASGYPIYNAGGVAMLASQRTEVKKLNDKLPPTISTISAVAANNTYMDLSMSEGIYTSENGTGGLTPSDFTLTFTQNEGTATGVSISSVTKTDGTALSGGESAVRVFFNVTGTPSGVEKIEIQPANATAIYDKAGNAVSFGQTTGVKTLKDQLPPTTTSPALNSNTKMTLALSEACTDIAKNNDGGFTIEQTGTPGITYEVFSVSEGSIILNTADMSASAKEGVTLKYTPGGNGAIKDSVGNLMTSFTTTFAPWDTTPPAITTISAVAANNTYTDVSMSEGVYTADNGTGGLTPSDFTLTFTKNAGNATGVSISSVTKTDGTALSGGESAVRVFFNVTGTPSGVETIEIQPASATAIYDKAGNAMLATQITGAKTLNDKLPPTMVSAALNSDTQITFAMSEACKDIAKNNDGGFSIEQTGTPSITYAVTAIAQGATAKQVVLTVADMGVSRTLGVTLKYTPGGNGTIKDIAGNSMASFTTTFSVWNISNNSGAIGGVGVISPIQENDNKASVIIGGESHDDVMKLETGKTNDGSTEATITLNEKTKDVIDKKPDGTSFKINFPSDYDINNLVMSGDIVKKMEEKAIVLDITANPSTFALPAADIKIDDVAKKFGDNVALKDITVKISISKPDANMSAVITKKAEDSGFSIVAPAVDFAINCTYKNNTVAVTEFDSYVQNTTKLPDGITPEKITTAIYTYKDGTFHHVPTKITIIDGVYYAVVNSMISGTFTFVYHTVSFPDVENHWSKAVVNDMASRFIVYGYENGLYIPNGDITRAEFATIIIRGMGLPEGMGTNTFSDVPANKWYNGYVSTACKYGLISGYSSGKFGPNDKITREQAITIIARMMKWTGLKVSLTDSEKDALLASFEDNTDISDYARDSIAICLKSEIVVGRSATTIKPKGFLTRAEVAALVQRVLSKSGLI